MATQNEAAKLKSLSVRFPQWQAFPFIVLESIFFPFSGNRRKKWTKRTNYTSVVYIGVFRW